MSRIRIPELAVFAQSETTFARRRRAHVGVAIRGRGDGSRSAGPAGTPAFLHHVHDLVQNDRLRITAPMRFTFQFGELEHRGFGSPRIALNTTAVYHLEFTMPAAAPVFDTWIDDVALFL